MKKYLYFLCVMSLLIFWSSCGMRTEKLLLNKKWEVYNVTPPSGAFDLDAINRAEELKNGFYKNAWFQFLPDSVFITSFGNRLDTGKYVIRCAGKLIALYPKYGGRIYEEIQIQKLTSDKLLFNTVMADFHMTLHLKAKE